MRRFKRKIAQILTGAGAGLITASTIIAPGMVGATETALSVGDVVEVQSGDSAEYMVGEEKVEAASKSINNEDAYALGFEKADESEDEDKEFATIGDGLIDAEEETTIAAAIKKLDAEEISYADVQSIVWTVETGEKVYPVETVNMEALEKVYASIEDGSVMDAIAGMDVTSISAKSDKNDYVIFYYAPQVTEIQETVEAPTLEASTEEAKETPTEETTPVEVESDGKLVQAIAESVEEVKEDAEILESAVDNSGTTEVIRTDTEASKQIEETYKELKDTKSELESTPYSIRNSVLVVSEDAKNDIDDFWAQEVSAEGKSYIYTQTNNAIPIMKEGDKYVAFVVYDLNKNTKPTDFVAALNDDTGSDVLDFEQEWVSENTLKVTFPEKYVKGEVKNINGKEIPDKSEPLRIQSLVKYVSDGESEININLKNESSFKVNEISSVKASDFDLSVDIPLSKELKATNVEVYLNGGEGNLIAMDMATLNDGVLSIKNPTYAIQNIDIVIKDDVSATHEQKVRVNDDIEVIATYDANAFDTEVQFNATLLNDKELLTKSANIAAKQYKGLKEADITLFDMNFTVDGKEVEPNSEVNIKVIKSDKEETEYTAGVIHFFDDDETYELRAVEEVGNVTEYTQSSFSASAVITAEGGFRDENGNITTWDYSGKLPNFDASKYKVGDIVESDTLIYYNEGLDGSLNFKNYVVQNILDNEINKLNAVIWGDENVDLNAMHVDSEHRGSLNFLAYLDPDKFDGIFKDMINYYSVPSSWASGKNVLLGCSHIQKEWGNDRMNISVPGGENSTGKVKVRVLDMNLNTDKPYVVLGFATQSLNTQSGTGIMKFEIDKPKPKEGKVEIVKKSATPAAMSHSEHYSLEGAKFDFFRDEALKDYVGTIATNAEGKVTSAPLSAGTYYVKETVAPKGLKVDPTVKSVVVEPEKTTVLEFVDAIEDGKAIVKKVSANPDITNGNDCYSLAGAEFKFYNTREDALEEKGDFATAVSDAQGNTNEIGLWYGTYYVKETKAPKGFKKNNEVKEITVSKENPEARVEIADVPGTDPSRLELVKVDDSGKEMPDVAMEGAEFEIKYYANSKWEGTPSKTLTIVTGKNGKAKMTEELPAGTYTVQEKKAPAGYKVDSTIYKGSIKVLDDGTVKMDKLLQGEKALNAKDDNVFEIKNTRLPEVSTTATDKNTGVHSGVTGNTTITDTVTYKNLYEGKKYTMKGTLMDKETGKPLTINGKTFVVEKEFTPNAPDGTIALDFDVPAAALAGKSTVVFEELIPTEGRPGGEHKDINDKKQEVKFPSVGTKAIDKNSTIQAGVNGKTTYVDTVSFTNLDVGSKYKVTGVLMDKETGKELLVNGKTVTGSKTFDCEAESGTVKVEFDIDASALAGKSAVVFEKLFIVKKDGTEVEVAKHEDIKDGGQEIATPEIGTSAQDFKTKNHTAVIGETTLIDTVTYKNLIPGKEYTMKGTLINKATGKPVEIDGKAVTKTEKFTPKERDGKVEIKIDIDSSTLEGMDTVFFEELAYNGVKLTDHKEPGDDKQKIDFPKIRTTAIDGQTKNHTGVTGVTTIVDTVKYTNLTVGQEYILEGIVMDKATGKELKVNGKTVTATQKFTPKESQDGSVDITFDIDASELKGKDVVVFETLLQGKVKITEHKSINDKGQTVNYPEVRTKAINKETGNQTNTANGKTVIIDTVSYKNLTPGQEYFMQGKLVNKATGEFLKNEQGEDIVNKIPFTPETPTGTVEVPLEVDTSILQGEKIVVFEKCFQEDIEVTSHEDLEDIPQNTEVPTMGTTATDIQTGNHTGVAGISTIVDEVKYTGLTIGQRYIVKGVLMDKVTGEPVVIDGKEIVSEQEFVVGEEVEYTHPSMTEEATEETTEEATEEKDVAEKTEDAKTEETTEKTEDKTEETTDEKTEETTEKPYEGIEGVTSDGMVKLFYDLDATELKGHDVVVFETLYQIPNETSETPEVPEDETESETPETTTEPVKVISHEDIEDEGQTVSVPDAKTTATDANTTTHTAVVGKTKIVDEIKFTGLTIGEEYTFKGRLVDKETGEVIVQDGKEVTGEATIIAETKDGSAFVEFELDTELIAGKSAVAEEEVYYKDVKITDHKDLTDEDQTVNVPTIATTATGQNGKTVEYGSSVTIVDTVTYTNLTVGESYTISGTMVDQNGNAVSNVESVPFKAESANGSVEVKFVIDTTAHAGQKLVAFEELTAENGTKITEHKDLTDEGQTVYVNTPPEVVPPTTPNTGNKSGVMVAAGVAAGAAAIAGVALGKRRRKED